MNKFLNYFFAILAISVFSWSALLPTDRLTWWMEVAPSIIGFFILTDCYYRQKIKISTWLFVWLCIHSIILCVGGKYTYAEVPAGYWIKDIFHLSRNHYDRLGHFAQGFIPAFLAREILIKNQVVKNTRWLNLFVVSICLAFSAFYELIEFAAANTLDSSADAFLGTQGDVWDTQKDMQMALIGASISLLFSKAHDRSINKLMTS